MAPDSALGPTTGTTVTPGSAMGDCRASTGLATKGNPSSGCPRYSAVRPERTASDQTAATIFRRC